MKEMPGHTLSKKAGAAGAATMVDLMGQWVAKLASDGKTTSEIRDKVIGTFYDNVTLMQGSKATRNETIALANAMVAQAVDALSGMKLVRADALHAVRSNGV